MKIKDGVETRGLNIKMRKVLMAADHIWKSQGQELVLTEGVSDLSEAGVIHSEWSLHPFGMAVDLRTYYFTDDTKNHVAELLREELDDDYDVVVEDTHIHVERDPK